MKKVGFKPDDEQKISKIVQKDDSGMSVKDRGGNLQESAHKSDGNVGFYDGMPNPTEGVSYNGAGMEKELADLQAWTKGGK